MMFCCLGGTDYWIVLDLSQTSLWVPQSYYCSLCLYAIQHFLATAHMLMLPAVYLLQSNCYCICTSFGHTTDTVVPALVVVHCGSDNGILSCSVFLLRLIYICPQEEGAAYCQNAMGCFPSKGPAPSYVCSHYDLNTMFSSEIINWCWFCTYCLFFVHGILCSLKNWLYIGLLFILHLDIFIYLIFLVKSMHDKYLAQIVLCTRYCAPAWILKF